MCAKRPLLYPVVREDSAAVQSIRLSIKTQVHVQRSSFKATLGLLVSAAGLRANGAPCASDALCSPASVSLTPLTPPFSPPRSLFLSLQPVLPPDLLMHRCQTPRKDVKCNDKPGHNPSRQIPCDFIHAGTHSVSVACSNDLIKCHFTGFLAPI